ncbi:MAG: 2TM domain-containing protein [Maribacter sp.]|nr:2TM domain-containing protein [Maribacter sp.]
MQTRKRVDAIKAYYAHLILYLIASIALLSLKARILDYFVSKGLTDSGTHRWMEWNIIFIPIVWGLILLVYGIYLFLLKPGVFKNWEQRQLKK